MKRSVKLLSGMVIALPVVGLLGGCAGRRPVAELARADQAVRHAQTTSEADRYAPLELTAAQAKLASARRAMDDGDYQDARRLAEQALADAQLAESKAESQIALDDARRVRSEVQVIQTETVAPDTVVIERQATVQRAVPQPVVVERATAPAVVVEHAVTPTSVVVERPQPPAVVIEHTDPPVLVVPE